MNIRDFLPPLVDEILRFLQTGVPVATDLQIEDIVFEANILSSLGIIINECLTNSMKHAFLDVRAPCICIEVSQSSDTAKVVYRDNGSGISGTGNVDESFSFGFKLITMLVQQLDGTLDINGDEGTRILIEFPHPYQE